MQTMRSDLAGCPVIIGGGLAGLMTALRLAPRPVILLAKVPLSEGAASAWAQGGIAAAVGEDDRPALHAADTLAAGDGLSDPAVASRIAAAAPAAIIELERHGVALRPRSGRPPGARPGGSARPPPHRPCRGRRHGRRDHARPGRRGAGHALDHGDRGAGSPPPAGRRPRHRRRAGGRSVRRLPAAEPPGRAGDRRAGRALCPHHQPAGRHRPGPGAGRAGRRGAGRHGVRAVPSHRPGCRARSHAAGQRGRARRGRGAGRRDRRALHGGPGPRRARAARRRLARRGGAHRGRPSRLPRCPAGARRGLRQSSSPASRARCRAAGIDPVRQPIPVRPAAHYHMGGVAVDAEGRSTVEGLWACGEVAATGLHGANRLASNSLLEAVVMASAVADSIVGTEPAPLPAARPVALPPAPDVTALRGPISETLGVVRDRAGLRAGGRASAAARLQGRRRGRSGAGRPDDRHRGPRARGKPRRALARRFPAELSRLGAPAGPARPRHRHQARLPGHAACHHPATSRRRSLSHDALTLAHPDDRGAGARRPAGGSRPRRRPHHRCHRAGHAQGRDGAGGAPSRRRRGPRRGSACLPPGRSRRSRSASSGPTAAA